MIFLDDRTLDEDQLTLEIEKIISNHQIPSVSIAIINDNETVYQKALGVSNSVTQMPINSQSIYEAASLSKPIFAYFVLKLIEEGLLTLDQPLHDILPHTYISSESKDEYKIITARMVLSHQTGFPNHALGEKIKLAFKPGTDFMYSGEGFQYLANVIAKLKGIDCGLEMNTLFQEKVTKPLGMSKTTFVWNDYLETYKVYGHDVDGQPTQNKPGQKGWNGNTFNAYSSLHCEASDYAKFIIAMLKREGLKSITFDEMLKEQTAFTEENPLKKEMGQTGWGLGFTQKRISNYTMHFHTGNNHDFQSYALFVPEKQYGLVVFINSGQMVPFLESLSKIIGPQF